MLLCRKSDMLLISRVYYEIVQTVISRDYDGKQIEIWMSLAFDGKYAT